MEYVEFDTLGMGMIFKMKNSLHDFMIICLVNSARVCIVDLYTGEYMTYEQFIHSDYRFFDEENHHLKVQVKGYYDEVI